MMMTEMLKSQLHRELRNAGFKPASVQAIVWTKVNSDSYGVILNSTEWTFDNETRENGFYTGDYSADSVALLVSEIRASVKE